MSETNTYNATKTNYFSTVVLLVILVFAIYKYAWPKINTSWVVEEACTEVKSYVYSIYGEVPTVSGSIRHKNNNDYIVIVSYSLREIDLEGKVACHVHGYRKGNCVVSNMTSDMPDGYNFNVEELKARWGI